MHINVLIFKLLSIESLLEAEDKVYTAQYTSDISDGASKKRKSKDKTAGAYAIFVFILLCSFIKFIFKYVHFL